MKLFKRNPYRNAGNAEDYWNQMVVMAKSKRYEPVFVKAVNADRKARGLGVLDNQSGDPGF